MELNRADMKLLIEVGYSSVIRNLDTQATPIFDAIDQWMPNFCAGPIGIALEAIVAGDFAAADAMLTQAIETRPEGKAEARSILALCKALNDEWQAAEELADCLKGEGGHAESFARTLIDGPPEQDMHTPDRAASMAGE